MLKSYIEPIMTAVWVFPILAAFFTLPYLIHQYRKFGAIPLLRSVVIYSFIFYMMCAYFLTMLPLPSIESVRALKTPTMQLIPFYDAYEWISKSGFVLTNPSTWKGLIVNRDLFQLVANIVMTIPLGIYLRYYFGRSFKQTLVISLCVSLVFELTQLSGLFFIYPRPYRLCDVDDLITNTLGGCVGYWIAAPFLKILPSKERLDAVAYKRGVHVSVTRRLAAAAVDWALIFVVGIGVLATLVVTDNFGRGLESATVLLDACLGYVLSILIYFIFGSWLFHGSTLGQKLVKIRVVDVRDESRPRLWQCLVRYAVLYYAALPAPILALVVFGFAQTDDETTRLFLFFLMLILIALYVVFLIVTALRALLQSSQLPHGTLSKTKTISTLPSKQITTAQ